MLEKDGEEFFSPTEIDLVSALDHVGLLLKGTQLTPLGVLRTSTPRVLFNKSERYGLEEDIYFSTSTVSGATSTHDNNKAARVLSVSTTTGSKAVRQTHRYFRYVKGSPQVIITTGNLKGAVSGVIKTLGYFDEENGIFFRLNGITPQVVVRSKTSGSVVDVATDQQNWDDPLDGTGPSGLTVDWSKQQFFYFDFAWLGIADIRFGMYLDGKVVIFHTIKSVNSLATSWAQSAVLPLRAEIENTASTASTMELTCYVVQTEDGNNTTEGSFKYLSFGPNVQTANVTEKIFLGIRLNPSYRGNIFPSDYGVIVPSGNSIVYFKVIYNPVLTGATWEDLPNSIAQGLTNQPTFTGGYVIDEGYSAVGVSSVIRNFKTDIQLGRGLTDTDVIVLVARTTNSNSNLLVQGSWREDT